MASYMCRNCVSLIRNPVRILSRKDSKFLVDATQQPRILIPFAGYAKKAAKGGGAKAERLYDILEVNTDPEYLVQYCAGTCFFKEGVDVKLKPDEEYPDWLWSLHTGRAKPLEELDPETPQYWRRLRKMHMKRNNRLAKHQKF